MYSKNFILTIRKRLNNLTFCNNLSTMHTLLDSN